MTEEEAIHDALKVLTEIRQLLKNSIAITIG
jgi:hypothetical protein